MCEHNCQNKDVIHIIENTKQAEICQAQFKLGLCQMICLQRPGVFKIRTERSVNLSIQNPFFIQAKKKYKSQMSYWDILPPILA
jgi:hypothetical protein